MAVEFGILLPTREAVMSGRPETAPMLAMAERAEAAGFDSVWIGDSLTARPRHEPLTLLAAVAARTRRVQLGTAVLLPVLWMMWRDRDRSDDPLTGADTVAGDFFDDHGNPLTAEEFEKVHLGVIETDLMPEDAVLIAHLVEDGDDMPEDLDDETSGGGDR